MPVASKSGGIKRSAIGVVELEGGVLPHVAGMADERHCRTGAYVAILADNRSFREIWPVLWRITTESERWRHG